MNSIKHLEYYQCRACYDSKNNLQLLTNFAECNPSQTAGVTYMQLLYEVCNINIQDDKPLGQWPQFICFNCSEKLKLAYDFIQQTLKINQLLKSIASLLEKEDEMVFIQKPELDIPLDIKTEKEEVMEVLPSERVFQYSPIETEIFKAESKNEVNTSNDYTWKECTNNKMVEHENENIKEIIVPSEIEFLNNDPTVMNDLDSFHSEYLNYMDSTKSNSKAALDCDECNTLLPSTCKLKCRKCLQQSSEKDKISCSNCVLTFSKTVDLKRHLQTAHKQKDSNLHTQLKASAVAGDFNCNECSKIFTAHYKLLRHKRFVHIAEEKKIKCQFCVHKFARKDHFKRHMKRVHNKEVSFYQETLIQIKATRFFCDKCNRSFTRHDRLLKHKKDIH